MGMVEDQEEFMLRDKIQKSEASKVRKAKMMKELKSLVNN